MSADVLRRAAALMRERAEAVRHDVGTIEAWEADVRDDGSAWISSVNDGHMLSAHGLPNTAEHIAAADPPFMLAVADMLDLAAQWTEDHPGSWPPHCKKALDAARTYLREQP